VDFTSQEFFRDPAGGIETLRKSGSIIEAKFPIIGKVWVTTTYDTAAQVLKDSRTFTLRMGERQPCRTAMVDAGTFWRHCK
jgi:cytochrome P450 PksS